MTRQEQRWRKVRWLEVGMTLLAIIAFSVLNSRHMSATVFAAFMAVFALLTVELLRRQYQALDELGKMRWLKSYLAMALIYSLGLSGLVLWALWQGQTAGSLQPPALPFYGVFTVMVAGGLASWATWHYIGWRDLRG